MEVSLSYRLQQICIFLDLSQLFATLLETGCTLFNHKLIADLLSLTVVLLLSQSH